MPNLVPVPKIAAATIAGAGAVIIVWIISLFHVDVPDPVEAAFAVLIAAGAGYLTPSAQPGPNAAGDPSAGARS